MRLIACNAVKHSFNWQGEPVELVFNGQDLELDDDLARHLLSESPGNFTDKTPAPEEPTLEAPETPVTTEGVDAPADGAGNQPASSAVGE